MKSTSLSEVKTYTTTLKTKIDVGVPKGKLMNKAQQKNLINQQKAACTALDMVIAKIESVENRE